MSTSPANLSPSGVETSRVNGYLIFLFVLLSTATLFDGFDSAMMIVAAPMRVKRSTLAGPNGGLYLGLLV